MSTTETTPYSWRVDKRSGATLRQFDAQGVAFHQPVTHPDPLLPPPFLRDARSIAWEPRDAEQLPSEYRQVFACSLQDGDFPILYRRNYTSPTSLLCGASYLVGRKWFVGGEERCWFVAVSPPLLFVDMDGNQVAFFPGAIETFHDLRAATALLRWMGNPT